MIKIFINNANHNIRKLYNKGTMIMILIITVMIVYNSYNDDDDTLIVLR